MRTVLLLALVLASTAALALDYSITVEPTGIAFIEISTKATLDLTLPPDAEPVDVSNGILSHTGSTATIAPQGTAHVSYSTAYYTSKEQGIWKLSVPIAAASDIRIVLPDSVVIVSVPAHSRISTSPQVAVEHAALSAERIELTYVIPRTERSTITTLSRAPAWPLYALILLLIALGATRLLRSRRAKIPAASQTLAEPASPSVVESDTPASQRHRDVLVAASENEKTVLTLLISANGKMKRNHLERQSGISKSSLASTLHGLEKKELLKIDRTFKIHYITLTDWFEALK